MWRFECRVKSGMSYKLAVKKNVRFGLKDTTISGIDPCSPHRGDYQQRIQNARTRMRMISLSLYIVFLTIIFYLSYSSEDHRSFLFSNTVQNELLALSNGIAFTKVKNVNYLWRWLDSVVIPALYANDNTSGYSLFTRNLLNRRIGVPRLRQHRVKYGACMVETSNVIISKSYCEPEYSSASADTSDYNERWTLVSNSNDTLTEGDVDDKNAPAALKLNSDKANSTPVILSWKPRDPWKYNSAYGLLGVPYMGKRSVYGGGGYVVMMSDDKNNTTAILQKYKEKGWLDDRTRAVMVEFTLYNINTNLFLTATMLIEFLVTGSAVVHSTFRVYRLFDFMGIKGNVEFALQLVYCCFILYFFVHMVLKIRRQKCRFFHKFWNLVDVVRITLFIACIALYGLKKHLTKQVRAWLKLNEAESFFNLQSLSAYNEVYSYTLAMVVFLATLQFLKLLQFNLRLRMLGDVLHVSYIDLRNFSIFFFVFLFSFSMCATLLFGRVSPDFYNFAGTIESLFTIALGDFAYGNIDAMQIVIAPAYFFIYIVVIYVVLMTIFLSILNKAISEVRSGMHRRQNNYHIARYISGVVSGWCRSLNNCLYVYIRREGINKHSPHWKRNKDCIHTMSLHNEPRGITLSRHSLGYNSKIDFNNNSISSVDKECLRSDIDEN